MADNFAYEHIQAGSKDSVSSLLEKLRYYGIKHFEGDRLLLFESIFNRQTIIRVRKPWRIKLSLLPIRCLFN